MKEKLMEILIDVEDVAVELQDRAEGDFDNYLVSKLQDAVKHLETLYKEAV